MNVWKVTLVDGSDREQDQSGKASETAATATAAFRKGAELTKPKLLVGIAG